MSAASNYLENEVLDHVLGKGARDFTSPANLYVALFDNVSTNTAANLEAGTLTDEVDGTSYTRETVAFGVASAGAASNSADIEFGPAGSGGWGTVTHIAVMDAETAGNVLFWGALSASKTIAENDSLRIAAGNLTITLA